MQTRPVLYLALACSLFAAPAIGQTPTDDPLAMPPDPPMEPRTTPPVPPPPVQARPAVPAVTPFEMLDLDEEGRLTKEQAANDPWLLQNFVRCDANHNDEVTQSEYETCTTRR